MSDFSDRIGTVVDGKYEIQRLVGKGGMGAVFAARHIQLDRLVALKLLRLDVSAGEPAVARFHREARAMARIEHPNAVRVYDFGETDDGAAYIVMEFIEGIPLRVMLRRARILPLDVVLEVVWQAAAAIAAAHGQGIVHRDLKPENLIVRLADDGAITLKVVDFGLAKLLAGDTEQLTSPSEMVGTPKYMAPEQFAGDDLDERVDVYGLGVIVFELLTGRPPFEGTFSEIVGKHLHVEPPTFASLGVELPEAIEVVVRRALAKRPAERPASVSEFARQFVRCFGVEAPVGTSQIGTAQGTSRSALLDAFPEGFEAPVRDEADYATQYSDRDEAETRVRATPVAHIPTELWSSSPEPQVSPEPPAAAAPPSRAPIALALVVSVAVGVGAVGVVGYAALRALQNAGRQQEPPQSIAPATAVPSATAEPPSPVPTETDEDDGAPGDRTPGIPFFVKGRMVIFDDGDLVRPGDTLEILDPETGKAEAFALEPNDKGTKWVVKRTTRSTPGGRLVADLVEPNAIVEMRIRHADGSASAPIAISRSDE